MAPQIVTLHSKISDSVTSYIILFCFADNSCELNWPTCYQIIKGTCEGLNHLHNDHKIPILHLHLNPSHILLDNNMTAKITGFGLLRTFGTSPEVSHQTEELEGKFRHHFSRHFFYTII